MACSRTKTNAERFAADLEVATALDDYAAAAASDVDAVYIATPPSEHERHALIAIEAGKPVLLEKPFATDAAAAQRIVDAARANGVFCMEALWTRFLPLLHETRSVIDAGELGELRGLHGTFASPDQPAASPSMFDPERAGGALMHLGVYPISLARHLLGPVVSVEAMGRIGETGVDEDTVVVMRHESGAISTSRSSLRTADPNGITIYGTDGVLDIDGPVYRPHAATLSPVSVRQPSSGGGGRLSALKQSPLVHTALQRAPKSLMALRGGRGRSITARYDGNGYHYEAKAVMDAVAAGDTEHSLMPLDESVEIMQILDRARAGFESSAGRDEGASS